MNKTLLCVMLAILLGGCTNHSSSGGQTALFRSDWKNGQRAKVTQNLIASLMIGMTKEEVAAILEYPSRPGDEIVEKENAEEWIFTITLGRILILRFENNKLAEIDGG